MWYRCFIRGENFPGQLARSAVLAEGAKPVAADEPVGFFVTRFVEADSADQAEQKALLLLRSEPKLTPPEGYLPSSEARVFFEEITEVERGEVPDPQPGFVFHSMKANASQ